MNYDTLQQRSVTERAASRHQMIPAQTTSGTSSERGRTTASHVASLDVLRATAALMVFCYHCTTELGSQLTTALKPTLMSGNLGVQLFFALSGYLIYATLDKSGLTGGCTSSWAVQFWIKRIFRIYPLYIFSIFAVLVAQPNLWQWTTFGNLTTHFFGLHSLVRNHHGAINGSLWTLSLEIQFYIIAPFVYLAVRKRGERALILSTLAIWIVSYVVCRSILIDECNFWTPTARPDSWSYFIGLNQLPSVFIFFAMGFLAYRLRAISISPSVPFGALVFFLVFPYLLPWISNLGIDPVLLNYIKPTLMSSCFVPILIFASQVKLPVTRGVKFMTWVSWLSYSFYVWHLLVIRWMASVYPEAGFVRNSAISLILTLVLSEFTARYIEQPGIAVGSWLSRKIERR